MRTVLRQGAKGHERIRSRDETGQEWGMKDEKRMDTGRLGGW